MLRPFEGCRGGTVPPVELAPHSASETKWSAAKGTNKQSTLSIHKHTNEPTTLSSISEVQKRVFKRSEEYEIQTKCCAHYPVNYWQQYLYISSMRVELNERSEWGSSANTANLLLSKSQSMTKTIQAQLTKFLTWQTPEISNIEINHWNHTKHTENLTNTWKSTRITI